MAVKKFKVKISKFYFHRFLLNDIVNNPAKFHWNPMRTVGGVVIFVVSYRQTDERTEAANNTLRHNIPRGKNVGDVAILVTFSQNWQSPTLTAHKKI